MVRTSPRIADIARKLSLSNTAVGEILRGKEGYNEETRRLVMGTAKQMGYRPNYLSRALAGGSSKTIGLLVTMNETPILTDMVRTIELSLRSQDYLCYVVDLAHESESTQVKRLNDLLDRRVDGLIVNVDSSLPPDVNELLDMTEVPVVRVGHALSETTRAVHLRRDRGLRDMATHLADLGHREAAYITTEFTFVHPGIKLDIYRDACAAANITLDYSKQWMVPPGMEYEYGCKELIERQIREGEVPTALLLNCDQFAMEAISALHAAGLRVPEDVSVVGFNDDYFASISQPPLTTIRQPYKQVGQAISTMLLGLLKDPGVYSESIYFNSEFIVRDSTGPVFK